MKVNFKKNISECLDKDWYNFIVIHFNSNLRPLCKKSLTFNCFQILALFLSTGIVITGIVFYKLIRFY